MALRNRKVRDLGSYQSVFWFGSLPDEPEVYTRAWGTEDENEPWLRLIDPIVFAFQNRQKSAEDGSTSIPFRTYRLNPSYLTKRFRPSCRSQMKMKLWSQRQLSLKRILDARR